MYHPTTFAYNTELQFTRDDAFYRKLRKPPIMTIAHQYDTSHDISLQKILVSATLTHDPGPLKRFNLYFPHLFAPRQSTKNRSIRQVSEGITNLSETYDPKEDSTGRFINGGEPSSSVEDLSAGVGQFTTPLGLKEFVVCAKASQRVLFLVHLIRHRKVKNILCFTNSRNEADRLGVVLSNFQNISVSIISSGMPVEKRQRILNSFVSGDIKILICTDSMARGMDIADVYCVVNYEMPSSVKTYVHRVGRTARAGKSGLAYTLLDRNQFFHFKRDLRNVGKGKIKEFPFHGSQTIGFQAEYKKAIQALKSSVLYPFHGPSWYNCLWVCLLLTGGPGLLLADDYPDPSNTRHATCGLRQHGFHLNLRCHLLGPAHAQWEQCLLKLRLHRGLFVDPYELASRQPTLDFTLAKPKSSGPHNSKLGRMFMWFMGDSGAETAEDLPFEYHHQGEMPMRHGDVDVEAPEWMSDPMTLNLALGWGSQVKSGAGPAIADIPVHMRYRLPSYGDDLSTLDSNVLPAPMLNCNDGDDFIETSSTPSPLLYTTPRPLASDLFFVMPITILLLTVGVAVLLVA